MRLLFYASLISILVIAYYKMIMGEKKKTKQKKKNRCLKRHVEPIKQSFYKRAVQRKGEVDSSFIISEKPLDRFSK